jgi:hypothetical protein
MDGIFTLDGEVFDIKIDNNRKIYVRKKNGTFANIGTLDLGYSSEEKKKYIYNLYKQLMERRSEMNNKQ